MIMIINTTCKHIWYFCKYRYCLPQFKLFGVIKYSYELMPGICMYKSD